MLVARIDNDRRFQTGVIRESGFVCEVNERGNRPTGRERRMSGHMFRPAKLVFYSNALERIKSIREILVLSTAEIGFRAALMQVEVNTYNGSCILMSNTIRAWN